MQRTQRLVAVLAVALTGVCATSARADKVTLKDGRTITGSFAQIASMSQQKPANAEGAPVPDLIFMGDNGLKRVFVSHRAVQNAAPGEGGKEEIIKIKNATASGASVMNVGAIVNVTPFDEFGRRTCTLNTPGGLLNIVQGIREITPTYTRVEAFRYTWDMRLATSSFPRDALLKILHKSVDPKSEDQRLKVARFLIDCRRYGDAKAELDAIEKDFPALKAQVQPVARSLVQLRARQILGEIEVRQSAGQLRLVRSMLDQFPVEGVSGEILQTVRALGENLRGESLKAESAWTQFHTLAATLPTEERDQLLPIRDEIFARRSVLAGTDVRNFTHFCTAVAEQWLDVENGGALAGQMRPSPGRRLWALFPPEVRRLVVDLASNGQQPNDPQAFQLLQACNEVLSSPDFFAEPDFAAVPIPAEATSLLQRPANRRTAADIVRMNRLLLEASYPNDIAVSQFVGLTMQTLVRLEPFLQFANDPNLQPSEKLALAVTGWLLGSNSAKTNLPVALSLWNTRNLVRAYLNEPVKLKRDHIYNLLLQQEGANPELVSKILANMPPQIETPPQEVPGFYELTVPTMPNEPDVTYFVQLPPEYDPHTHYPTIVSLHGIGAIGANSFHNRPLGPPPAKPAPAASDKPEAVKKGPPAPLDPLAANDPLAPSPAYVTLPNQIDWWAGSPDAQGFRSGQSMRQGYIIIAPNWTTTEQREYTYSAREHACVLNVLRDASRRFAIDTDRVYLHGHGIGADAVFDIGLAHPDLWAGIVPIVGTSDKYCMKYWENAALLPIYFVGGELDGDRMLKNTREFDRFFKRGFDLTVVDYKGRGYDDFGEEILDLFDWMKRRKRNFYPKEFAVSTMRPWDNFFWWIEVDGMPVKNVVYPIQWTDKARSTMPIPVEATVLPTNIIRLKTAASKITVYLSPDIIDFTKPAEILFRGDRLVPRGVIEPNLGVMLEDVRTRGDRQHPFWARISN